MDLRSKMSTEEVSQKSERIIENIQNFHIFKNAHTVLFFAPHHQEPDILPLAEKYMQNKTLCFPRVMSVPLGILEAFSVSSITDLIPGNFGILEPPEIEVCHVAPENIDMILVPALAIDQRGNRLGYGKGFFDRFLIRTNALAIGVIFSSFVFPKIPSTFHDVPLAGIITENGFLKI